MFIIKDRFIKLPSGYLELFMPEYYTSHGMAEILGTEIKGFGLVFYKYYNKKGDAKPSKVGVFNMPAAIKFYPYDIIYDVDDTIYQTGTMSKYTKMVFNAGDNVCDSVIIKSLDSVMMFTTMLLDGKIDINVPYDNIVKIWTAAMDINSIDFKAPATVLEIIVSEIYRDKKKHERPFRLVVGKDPKTDMLSYYITSVSDLAGLNNVMAGIMSEDMNAKLDSAIVMQLTGADQVETPLENIIKM